MQFVDQYTLKYQKPQKTFVPYFQVELYFV